MLRGLIFGVLRGGFFAAIIFGAANAFLDRKDPAQIAQDGRAALELKEAAAKEAAEQAAEAAAQDATEEVAPVEASTEAPTDAAPDAPAETPVEDAADAPAQETPEQSPEIDAAPQEGEAPVEPVAPDAVDTPADGPIDATATDTVEAAPAPTGPSLTPSGRSGLGTSAGSLTDREDPRVSSRLPSASSQSDTSAAAEATASLGALRYNSVPFSLPEPEPQLSFILVDIKEIEPNAPAVSALPFPVAFAIPGSGEEERSRANAFRSADREVLSVTGFPEGARPQDVAVTLDAVKNDMPEILGFLDTPDATYQQSREVAAEAVANAQSTGHGLISSPSGLNSLIAEARRADAPAGLIYRDFDGQGQDINAMKRFLDQAAFRASVQGNIIVLGRAKPDTLQALAEWALSTRAQSVAIVPISYQLLNYYVAPEEAQ